MARSTIPFGMYYDNWAADSELSIKDRRKYTHGENCNKYDVYGYVYPRASLLPTVKRNGFQLARLDDCPPANRFISLLLKDREAEMLVKLCQYQLLYHKWRYGSKEFALPDHAIKIASRHGYIVQDASLWLDYISLLEHYGYDTHSPKYVCNSDFKKFHDRLSARKKMDDAKEESVKWEKDYKRSKSPYFGICFGDDNIVVTVIKSVADMAEEGEAMHHCVFSMGYYKRPESLILTARDKDGNRIETIELSLSTFDVVQSRGVCNKNSERHDEIVALVRKNVPLFVKAKKMAHAA